MLKEGKERVSTYIVYWEFEERSVYEYVRVSNSQQAVDFVRQYLAPKEAKIMIVAKVVNNWK